MSRRFEFTKSTKTAALARSGGQCEAVGERYGHAPGVRCTVAIGWGFVHFDHWPRPARDPHPDTRKLGNCLATCPGCNMRANNLHDTPREAKMKRVQAGRGRTALQLERTPKAEPKMRSRGQLRGGGFKQGHRPLKSRNDFQRRER